MTDIPIGEKNVCHILSNEFFCGFYATLKRLICRRLLVSSTGISPRPMPVGAPRNAVKRSTREYHYSIHSYIIDYGVLPCTPDAFKQQRTQKLHQQAKRLLYTVLYRHKCISSQYEGRFRTLYVPIAIGNLSMFRFYNNWSFVLYVDQIIGVIFCIGRYF